MFRLRYILSPLLFAALVPGHLIAKPLSPGEGHPIAYERDACMEEGDWQPAAMLACARAAEANWRDEVERLTERLAKVLGREAREALEVSDREWRRGFDADLALIDAYHAQLTEAELGEPAVQRLTRQFLRNALLEERAMSLQRLLDGLEVVEPSFEAPSNP